MSSDLIRPPHQVGQRPKVASAVTQLVAIASCAATNVTLWEQTAAASLFSTASFGLVVPRAPARFSSGHRLLADVAPPSSREIR